MLPILACMARLLVGSQRTHRREMLESVGSMEAERQLRRQLRHRRVVRDRSMHGRRCRRFVTWMSSERPTGEPTEAVDDWRAALPQGNALASIEKELPDLGRSGDRDSWFAALRAAAGASKGLRLAADSLY